VPGDEREYGLSIGAAPAAQGVADFERQLRECQRLVFRVAYAVLDDRADAEEVTQDVFLQAYRKLATLSEAGKFRAWVARMSWRLAINRQRAASRARRRDTSWWQWSAPRPPSVEKLAAEREFQSRLRAEIERLPEKLRAVLLLSAVEELDTREIAETLQIPEGTVRSRLHLARKQLLKVFSHERM
jgi:RNA polymerase sigma-70 factor (ECF subfamily)